MEGRSSLHGKSVIVVNAPDTLPRSLGAMLCGGSRRRCLYGVRPKGRGIVRGQEVINLTDRRKMVNLQ